MALYRFPRTSKKGSQDAPSIVAETIRLAGAAGLVGASIEDATGDASKPLFDPALAAERVAAAAEAASVPTAGACQPHGGAAGGG
jgi:2-methylisocitrate lyase-like PEP mutase family enzyme